MLARYIYKVKSWSGWYFARYLGDIWKRVRAPILQSIRQCYVTSLLPKVGKRTRSGCRVTCQTQTHHLYILNERAHEEQRDIIE